MEHGYEGASLARIANSVGCTTGAIYANFTGKDALFVAVLDSRLSPSMERQADLFAADVGLQAALGAVGRFLVFEYDEEPRWAALAAEYWARAARYPEFRALAAHRHEAILREVGRLLTQLAQRHDFRWALPALEVARGAGALARGVRMERALGLEIGPEKMFEKMFVAFLESMIRAARR